MYILEHSINIEILLVINMGQYTQKRKLVTCYAQTCAGNLGSQQNQRKTKLAKLIKTKPQTQKRKLLTRYTKTGAQNIGS